MTNELGPDSFQGRPYFQPLTFKVGNGSGIPVALRYYRPRPFPICSLVLAAGSNLEKANRRRRERERGCGLSSSHGIFLGHFDYNMVKLAKMNEMNISLILMWELE